MANLRFPCSKFSKQFSDWASLNASSKKPVQFLGTCWHTNHVRTFLMELCGGCETHGHQLGHFTMNFLGLLFRNAFDWEQTFLWSKSHRFNSVIASFLQFLDIASINTISLNKCKLVSGFISAVFTSSLAMGWGPHSSISSSLTVGVDAALILIVQSKSKLWFIQLFVF